MSEARVPLVSPVTAGIADASARLSLQEKMLGWVLRDEPGTRSALPDMLAVAADFESPLNRIAGAIGTLLERGLVITPKQVSLLMGKDDGLAQLKGVEYLISLADGAPAVASASQGAAAMEQCLRTHRAMMNRVRAAGVTQEIQAAIEAGRPFDHLARELAEYTQPDESPEVAAIEAVPHVWVDPTTIPRREWLYDRHLIRKFLSATIAPGGVGKSSLSIAEDLAMVTGRPLLGVSVPRALRVWSVNLEDPAEEIARRYAAARLRLGISEDSIGGRLFTGCGRNTPIVIARSDRNGAVLVEPVIDRVVAELIGNRIDVLRIDPFVSSHTVPENDNGATEMVAKAWARVADRANCAVDLTHHSRKLGDAEVTAEAARGASALVNACRSVRVLNRMGKDEATKFGVDNPRRFFRLGTDKQNLAPPAANDDWYEIVSVDLGNGGDGPGDHVGVATRWTPPQAEDGLAPGSLRAVQEAISRSQFRASAQAETWAGKAVADVLDFDLSDAFQKTQVAQLLKSWIAGGALKVVERRDETRKERKFIEVDQWVEP